MPSTPLIAPLSAHSTSKPTHAEAGLDFDFHGINFQGRIAIDNQQWALLARTGDIDLHHLVNSVLDVPLPKEIPNLHINTLSFTLSSEGDIRLYANITLAANTANTQALQLGASQFPIGEVELELKVSNQQPTIDIRFKGTGFQLIDEVHIDQFDLSFKYDAGNGWQLGGSLDARVLNESFKLGARYQQGQHGQQGQRLEFWYQNPAPQPLLNIPNVLTLHANSLTLSIDQQAHAPSDWAIGAHGSLNIANNSISLAGKLTARLNTKGRLRLTLTPDEALIQLPMPATATLDIAFGEISIARQPASGGNAMHWALSANASIACTAFHNALPNEIRQVFPKKVNAGFSASHQGITLRAKRLINPIDIELPPIETGANTQVPLGTMRLDVRNLSLQIGRQIEISCEFGLGLPSELNNVFGTWPDGETPQNDIFRTFDPESPESSLIWIRVSAGSDGLQLVLKSSPLKAMEFTQINNQPWWELNFGGFGAGRLQIPTLAFNPTTGAFEASGGFKITQPLAIPLTPIRNLLEEADLASIAELLPDSIPLEDINLLDENHQFQDAQLIEMLDAIMPNGQTPPELVTAINDIGSALNRLPTAFRNYLRFTMPTEFAFEFAVTADGGIRFKLGVGEGSPPIRILRPSMIGILPGLAGTEIYSLSFGFGLGGAVALISADLRFDSFDLATLAAALILPEDHQLPLPSPKNFHNRVIIDDLLMVVILTSPIPIPVPIFYNELGLQYLGLEGINLQAQIKFPMPQADIGSLIALISNFVEFFSNPNALMDPAALGNADLAFSVGNNFLQLPEYLGGKVLGYNGPLITIKAYATLARFMNMVRTFSISEAITSIPMVHRIGSETIEFGPIQLSAAWLLSTPNEFRQGAWQQLNLQKEQTSQFLQLAPRPQHALQENPEKNPKTNQEEGIVVFLRGEGQFGDWCYFEAAFGLAATDTSGFQTGFMISGEIIHLIKMDLRGRVAINAPDMPFGLIGETNLWILDHQIFAGNIEITDQHFTFSGELNLFPANSPLIVTGKLAGLLGEDQFMLQGAAEVRLFDLTLLAAQIELSNQRIFLSGTLLGVTATLDITETQQQLQITGEIRLSLWTLQAKTRVVINPDGISLTATMSNIDLGVFKLTGTGNNTQPTAALTIVNNQVSEANYSAAIELLGIHVTADITQSTNGIQFELSGELFGIIRSHLSVTGQNFSRTGLQVHGSIDFSVLNQIRDGAFHAVNTATQDINHKLTKAINDVKKAQAVVDRHNATIRQQRRIVEAERAVTRRNYNQALADLHGHQNEVNRIKANIDINEHRIRQLQQRGTHVLGIWIPDPLAVAEMAGIRLLITGQWVTHGTATAALEVARVAVQAAQGITTIAPVDADPRVFAPLALQKIETAALNTFTDILKTAHDASTAVNHLTQAIARGTRAVIDIHSIRFDLSLNQLANASSNTSFNMAIDLTKLGQRQTRRIAFNLHNPLDSIPKLEQLLLPR